MIKIQLHYDPLSVIPSDLDVIHEMIEPFREKVHFIENFSDEELDTALPTIFVENLETFNAELLDEAKPDFRIKSLLLLQEAIKSVMEKQNEQTK